MVDKPSEIEAPIMVTAPEGPRTTDSVSPNTTLEQDKRSAANRDINITWENTQAIIAKSVVFSTCVMVLGKVGMLLYYPDVNKMLDQIIPAEWWTIVGLVIGFYFGRTNHARQGDVSQGGTK